MSAFENNIALEEVQNCKNKMVAARKRFFASKVHKLKKMLKPIFKLMSCHPEPTPQTAVDCSVEDIQNAMNEALEAQLSKDVTTSYGISGNAIQALINGQVSIVSVTPASSVPVPVQFFSPAPGRFSWTFLPSADNDICLRGDAHPLSMCQTPEQQCPVPC